MVEVGLYQLTLSKEYFVVVAIAEINSYPIKNELNFLNFVSYYSQTSRLLSMFCCRITGTSFRNARNDNEQGRFSLL